MYSSVIGRLVAEGKLAEQDSVLVVCGGTYDRNVFHGFGIENVVISNLDHHGGVSDYLPYKWERQDAESIDHADGSVDWVVVHAGLHHCASPHKALCEMLRVACKGVVVIEARDSLLMKTAIKLGLVQDYEIQPALLSKGTAGGYRNTAIPNYVYRWTEWEVKKTTWSFEPHCEQEFDFHYGWALRTEDIRMSKM